MKRILVSLSLVYSMFFALPTLALTDEARQKGFVYLHEIDPTIQVSLRYQTKENFVGVPVNGYKDHVVIMTEQTAQALRKVQEMLKKDGYELVIYDAYRPQQAVDHFIEWGKGQSEDEEKEAVTPKQKYYPEIHRPDAFRLGYVGAKSSHSRGSTVDLTIIKAGQKVRPLEITKRTLLNDRTILFLDDNTVDMGSSFDLFDEASHHDSKVVAPEYIERRNYLKRIMMENGFKPYNEEWWHYTLKNEPYPANQESSYFNFPVEE